MEKRPKIKVGLTTTDKALEFVGWLSIVAVWGLTITTYTNLPDTIPTHFNAAGQADGFGGKATIFILPLIATILFVGMTVLNNFPHLFNYTNKITQENAVGQYTNATRLIRYLKLIVVFIFGLIDFETIQNVNGETDGLGIWFLPLTFVLVCIVPIYFVAKSSKN